MSKKNRESYNILKPDPYFSEKIATFGDRLCAAREDSQLSQKDLANRLGVTLKTIQAWENDVNEPRANKLQMVSALLNVSMVWLMSGLGNGIEPPKEKFNFEANRESEILTEIKDLRKGLSFKSKGNLNMRMGINDFSANDVISNMSQENLIKIFKVFGEEKFSKKIARKIIEIRKKKKIKTEDLKEIIDSIKKYKNSKINNSTKIFQALRIFVNKEISELINGLINSFNMLPIGGVIAVVTFHSLEDKIVKFFFRNYSESKNSSRYLPSKNSNLKYFDLKYKKPIIPNFDELKINPQSRSAKLRYAVKINNNCEFRDFKKKFQYLTDIESLKI